jgi:hypothetical protein
MSYIPAYAGTDGRISTDQGPGLAGGAGLASKVDGGGLLDVTAQRQATQGLVEAAQNIAESGVRLAGRSTAVVANLWEEKGKDPSEMVALIALGLGLAGVAVAGVIVYNRKNRGY